LGSARSVQTVRATANRGARRIRLVAIEALTGSPGRTRLVGESAEHRAVRGDTGLARLHERRASTVRGARGGQVGRTRTARRGAGVECAAVALAEGAGRALEATGGFDALHRLVAVQLLRRREGSALAVVGRREAIAGLLAVDAGGRGDREAVAGAGAAAVPRRS